MLNRTTSNHAGDRWARGLLIGLCVTPCFYAPPLSLVVGSGVTALACVDAPRAVRCRLFHPAICGKLDGNQLGELARDICQRIFRSAQSASRAEQRADFAESFIRRVVHDGNEQVACEECR